MMKSPPAGFYFLLTAACCSAVIALSLFSETSDIFSGIGTDGIQYYLYIPDLISFFQNKKFLPEAVDRLLPLSIAHFFYNWFFRAGETVTEVSLGACSLSLNNNFIPAFRTLNAAYLILAVVIWARICQVHKITGSLFALSLGLLLFNFMFLKQFFFEPVFIDPFIFFYAMLLLYAVALDKKWLQYCLLFFAFFINKLALTVTLLAIFLNSRDSSVIHFKIRRNFVLLIWLAAYLGMSLYLRSHLLCLESIENKTMHNLLPVSVLFVLIYTLYCWIKAIPAVIPMNISASVFKLIPVFAGMAAYLLLVKFFTKDESLTFCDDVKENTFTIVLNFVRQANSRPLGFLASHYNYLGMIVLCVILFISRIRKFLENQPGWIALLLCFLGASINSESRYLTIFLPFLTWMLIAAPYNMTHDILNSRIVIAAICLLNLLWSGFYKKINPLGTENYFNCKDMLFSNMFIDPLQKYFKHLGPWTSDESYYFQLAIFAGSLLLGGILLLMQRKGVFKLQ